MAIEVDTSEAPALLRFRIVGATPSKEEQDALRSFLIARGLLRSNSGALVDVREAEVPDAIRIEKSIAAVLRAGIPTRRACLINPSKHLSLIGYFQKAVPWMSTAAFSDEPSALDWLLKR